jgi:hypothetical protein
VNATQRWAVGVISSAAVSICLWALGAARAARADFESHKVENARDVATIKEAIVDIKDRLDRIQGLLDDRLPPRKQP